MTDSTGKETALITQSIQPSPARTRSGIFSDLAELSHLIEITEQLLLLDGESVTIKKVNQGQVIFEHANGDKVTICSTEALYDALLGNASLSPGDVGLLLAQNIARWLFEKQTTFRLRRLQTDLLAILEEHERGLRELLLPEMGLDPFVKQVLETIDGSPESERAIAFVLNKQTNYSHERIHELIVRAGERIRQLSAPPVEIAPGKPEQIDTQASAQTQCSVSPTDPANGNQGQITEVKVTAQGDTLPGGGHPLEEGVLPDRLVKAEAQELRTETTTVPVLTTQPGAQSSSSKRSTYQWSSGMEVELRQAFAALTQGSIASIVQTIAAEHNWPVRAVTYKLYELGLPQARRQQKQHTGDHTPASPPLDFEQSSPPDSLITVGAPQDSLDAPIAMEPGPYLWDVVIDGQRTRWGLFYSLGTFPFTKEGIYITFQGKVYVLQRAHHSQLNVSSETTINAHIENQAVPVL